MGHALLLLPRANSSPPLRNKTRMRRRCPETRSLQTPLRASPRYLIHRGRASPEPLGNWSRTRSTSGDGKQLRRLAAVRRLSGVRDTSCLTQGALCPLTVYPLSVSYRSTTERHVAIDLVAIAIRGDGRCHLGPVIPGVRFGGRRSHASTPGLIGSTAAATSARAQVSMSSARSSIDWRYSADISPNGAGMSPAIRRGASRQPRGGEAAASSIRYRRTAAMSSASSSACCLTMRGTSSSRSWWKASALRMDAMSGPSALD